MRFLRRFLQYISSKIHRRNNTSAAEHDAYISKLTKTYGRPFYLSSDGWIYDSLASSPDFQKIDPLVDETVEALMLESGIIPGAFGSCHCFWRIKKEILKEQYGIAWLSPAELNPHVYFD